MECRIIQVSLKYVYLSIIHSNDQVDSGDFYSQHFFFECSSEANQFIQIEHKLRLHHINMYKNIAAPAISAYLIFGHNICHTQTGILKNAPMFVLIQLEAGRRSRSNMYGEWLACKTIAKYQVYIPTYYIRVLHYVQPQIHIKQKLMCSSEARSHYSESRI